VATRDLVWDGCINVRDLGGLPTEDGGETRFGSVIRADSVGHLTAEGWQTLVGMGVTRIVDLRQDFEQAGDPPRDLAFEIVHVPIFEDLADETWATVQELSETAPTHAESQRRVYLFFLEQACTRFGAAVAAVAGAPEGTVVVHCHAGKDRTGLVSALLLRLAGVPAAAIAVDYALSGERLRQRHEEWVATAADDAERARIERIAATPAEAMRAVVEAIDEQYGGVGGYLLRSGLDRAAIRRARSRLR
jgi:protein tyrosine/serine phosphatase